MTVLTLNGRRYKVDPDVAEALLLVTEALNEVKSNQNKRITEITIELSNAILDLKNRVEFLEKEREHFIRLLSNGGADREVSEMHED